MTDTQKAALVAAVLLTPEQVADALSCGRTHVFGLIQSGALPSVKLGRLRRVPASAVEAYVARLMVEQAGVA